MRELIVELIFRIVWFSTESCNFTKIITKMTTTNIQKKSFYVFVVADCRKPFTVI